MALDMDYLSYRRRGRGMDHDLYRWSNLFERPPIRWPGDAAVAVPIVVSLEWFPILPNDLPFRAPGHMQTPYPDYRHYTSRDYGSRVGIYRLLDTFAQAGIRASVATNAAIAERYPALIADIVSAGHEIVAHATDMNATIATGLPEADERAIIGETLAILEAATGKRPAGWLSIARSQSFATPRLLAEAGIEYMLDWVNDELPYRMTTPAGDIVNLPLNHELSDRQIITVQQNSTDSYAEQIRDAFIWLDDEAQRSGGGRMLPLHLTPYIAGLPYRIGAIEVLLNWIVEQSAAWVVPAGDVVSAAREQIHA